MSSQATLIRSWFEKELGASLVLPDGWFGRPYDNQHSLTSLTEANGVLELVLDDRLRLRFEGPGSVDVTAEGLIFKGFTNVEFLWRPFGGGAQTSKTYDAGEVKLVTAPGARQV